MFACLDIVSCIKKQVDTMMLRGRKGNGARCEQLENVELPRAVEDRMMILGR